MSKNIIKYNYEINNSVCIKKFKLTKNKKIEDIIDFLISIQSSTNFKIIEYIEKCCNVNKFNKKTNSFLKLNVDKFFMEIYSEKFNKIISDIMLKDNCYLKYYEQLFRVYIIEKYAQQKRIVIGPHHISSVSWEDK
jgi:hypothetical protein